MMLNQIPTHKVFISYHHDNDEWYKNWLINKREGLFVDWSVSPGDIPDDISNDTVFRKIREEYLRDSTVTIVLIGTETWKRKFVDWEIGSSLRQTQYSSRSGVLGIRLPEYNSQFSGLKTLPPRLEDNILNGFAVMMDWTTDLVILKQKIHEAFLNRSKNPDNSRDRYARNR